MRAGTGPPADVVTALPGFDDVQKRVLAATVAGRRVIGLYVPNGQTVDSDKYRYKLDWCRAASAWLAEECTRHPELVVCGDFNIAPEDRDVHDPGLWRGQVLFSEPERAVFRDWLALGLGTASDCSTSRRRRSAGGTTGSSRFRRTTGCASTTSCSRRRSQRSAPHAASTATRAKARSRPITRR